MKKIHICFVSLSYFPGQGITALFEYSKGLSKIGHHVHAVVAARPGENTFDVVEGVFVERLRVKGLSRYSLQNAKFPFLAMRSLSRLMDVEPFDIVHIIGYSGSLPFGLVHRTLRRARALKHAKWLYDIRAGPVLPNRILRWFNKAIRMFESSLYDGVFVIDDMIANLAINKKMFTCPGAVDLELFQNKHNRSLLLKYGVKEDDVVFVYLGSLDYCRRVDKIIHAFGMALRSNKNLWLLILGEGSDVNRLISLSKKLNISRRLLFLGYIDYCRIPDFLSAADVGLAYVPIVPVFDKQPPQKTIEYLACSLPVIATRTRGNKRFLTHEKNGLLTADDPSSLSEAMIRLSLDVRLRRFMSSRARQSVLAYDSTAIARDVLSPAYEKVLYET